MDKLILPEAPVPSVDSLFALTDIYKLPPESPDWIALMSPADEFVCWTLWDKPENNDEAPFISSHKPLPPFVPEVSFNVYVNNELLPVKDDINDAAVIVAFCGMLDKSKLNSVLYVSPVVL